MEDPGDAALPLCKRQKTAQGPPDAAGRGEDDDVDVVCDVLSPSAQLDELCSLLSPRTSPNPSPTMVATAGCGGAGQMLPAAQSEDADLPLPALPLPPEVMSTLESVVMVARFNLGVELDLKKVAFSIRNAEYNPRKHGSITLRLFNPRTTALVRQSGLVAVSGPKSEEQMKESAKKVARLIQRCGYADTAKFSGYGVTTLVCKAGVLFPVRLELLATKWWRNALYEPETYCGCVFRTRTPKFTYLVTAGGKILITGCRRMSEAREALQRIYPVLSDLQASQVGWQPSRDT